MRNAGQAVIQTYRHQTGRFILATNLLDDTTWTAELILQEYKAQQTTERGFRFIKDPLFFASRVFLKSTKRIMALAMIMTLALMVYSLGQLQLRQALKKTNSTLPNQKGKPTARPTLQQFPIKRTTKKLSQRLKVETTMLEPIKSIFISNGIDCISNSFVKSLDCSSFSRTNNFF